MLCLFPESTRCMCVDFCIKSSEIWYWHTRTVQHFRSLLHPHEMACSSLCFPDPIAGWSLLLPLFCVSWSWELTTKDGSSWWKKLVKLRAKDWGRRLYLWIPSIYQSTDHKTQGIHACEVSCIGEHCRSSYVVLNFYGQCWRFLWVHVCTATIL